MFKLLGISTQKPHSCHNFTRFTMKLFMSNVLQLNKWHHYLPSCLDKNPISFFLLFHFLIIHFQSILKILRNIAFKSIFLSLSLQLPFTSGNYCRRIALLSLEFIIHFVSSLNYQKTAGDLLGSLRSKQGEFTQDFTLSGQVWLEPRQEVQKTMTGDS